MCVCVCVCVCCKSWGFFPSFFSTSGVNLIGCKGYYFSLILPLSPCPPLCCFILLSAIYNSYTVRQAYSCSKQSQCGNEYTTFAGFSSLSLSLSLSLFFLLMEFYSCIEYVTLAPSSNSSFASSSLVCR